MSRRRKKVTWTVRRRLSTRIRKLEILVDTKTKDNVFVSIKIWVQYVIQLNKAYEAEYRLSSPESQIKNYVFDVVRSTVPLQNLDSIFESKEDIAYAVKSRLKSTMDHFGYSIDKTLVTDITPNSKVREAMNAINTAKRNRLAAQEQAEAEKLRTVKTAEAEAEAMFLQGQGIARQRKAIIDGLKDSVADFSSSVGGVDSKDVLDLVLLTQYFDTLKELGATSTAQTLFVPHNPGAVASLAEEIKSGLS
ncbi:putative Hypersensitive-induced response protein 3 [Cardiosporidium cionae]|uniref:Hypersensitive-induced response protein 3 n=1 Tax=Cardiosporidium cionae TaxID=476202 RepID=A0ABQ7JGM0_9APIC|nr:putative Hypersensitive-induced response protein 3 [Cardiosporidium cionae]|eukprot:KAF8823113.1 putative Hypersensitive-induced response protein 3 [Cardiosporidium cionae]